MQEKPATAKSIQTRLLETGLGLGALLVILFVFGLGVNLMVPPQPTPTPTISFSPADMLIPTPTIGAVIFATNVTTYTDAVDAQAKLPYTLEVPALLPSGSQLDNIVIRSSPGISLTSISIRWHAGTNQIALQQTMLTNAQIQSFRDTERANANELVRVNGSEAYFEQRDKHASLLWAADHRRFILEADLPPYTRDDLIRWAESVH